MDPSTNCGSIISSMPDEILHHILSFLPTSLAIRTSVLSRRWRHVWCNTPCLDFYRCKRKATAEGIDQTLSLYRAPKITSFELGMPHSVPADQQPHAINRWIEFAVSRNVEKLSLHIQVPASYRFPDCFYLSFSLEELSVRHVYDMLPGCTVSWKSLRDLTLFCYNRFDEIANILSGSPNLETLRLFGCVGLLDLRNSLSLRTLEIHPGLARYSEAMEIIAPHVHHLHLSCREPEEEEPSTLVDVSSLTEASLGIFNTHHSFDDHLMADSLQTMVLHMLAKLQNVERLTFGGTILQVLSLAELRGVPFPTLKVQTLNLQTTFTRAAIPGIARLLQNSPGLKNLTAHATTLAIIKDEDLESYLESRDLNPDQCWISKYDMFPTSREFNAMIRCCSKMDAASQVVALFKEMVLREVKTLETMVVKVKYTDDWDFFKKLKEKLKDTL